MGDNSLASDNLKDIHIPVVDSAAVISEYSIGIVDEGSGPDLLDDDVVVDQLDRVELFGLDMVSSDSLEPVISDMLTEGRRNDDRLPVVVTPNVDILVSLAESQGRPEIELFRRARYCLPDGQPVVLVSKYLGTRLKARLAGSDLFAALWPRIVADQLPVVVVASSTKVAKKLQAETPDAEFIVPPMYDVEDVEMTNSLAQQVLEACERVKPRVVFVGIGHPKDARIISAVLDRWDDNLGSKPLMMGLGGSFLLYLGLTRRAPELIQRASLEWFYRFCQEPRRLFHRYFIRDMAFIGIVFDEFRATRGRR